VKCGNGFGYSSTSNVSTSSSRMDWTVLYCGSGSVQPMIVGTLERRRTR